ncbi:MAG: hypothetical protein U0414_30785 [Polyangiaceae bacterium]
MNIERYESLRGLANDGGIQRWTAVDSLTREEVSLWTTLVSDTNAPAMQALRAEAARLRALGLEARVFEDLQRGLLGLAFGGARVPGPTRPETRVVTRIDVPTPIVSAPQPTLAVAANPKRSHAWVALGGLVVASASLSIWIATRPSPKPAQAEDDPAPAQLASRATPSATVAKPRATPPPDVQPRARDCGADIAVATGCIDRDPVTTAAAAACATCPSPSASDADAAKDALRDARIATELDACRARHAQPTSPATCVTYAFARAYCAAQGKHVPTRAEWVEGEANRMTTAPPSPNREPTWEWTSDAVGETMNYTRGESGESQMRRVLRARSLGFRCVR